MTPIYKNSQAIKTAVEKLSSEMQKKKNVNEFTEVITGN